MTTARASAILPDQASAQSRSAGLAAALVAPATMVVILAVVLLLLMTPIWTHFAIGASGGTRAAATPEQAYGISDMTIHALLFCHTDVCDPASMFLAHAYTADEAAHLRDVRLVLFVFLGLAVASAVLLAWKIRHAQTDSRTWRSIARGGAALAVVLVVLGVFAALAFGVAFELFHRILFPGGNWAFDESSLLIRLYPYGFWQMSAAALGVLGITGGLLAWFIARRHVR